MRFRVQKLIRDRLPEIMRGQGLAVFDRRLDDAEYVAALGEKLVEDRRPGEVRRADDGRLETDPAGDHGSGTGHQPG